MWEINVNEENDVNATLIEVLRNVSQWSAGQVKWKRAFTKVIVPLLRKLKTLSILRLGTPYSAKGGVWNFVFIMELCHGPNHQLGRATSVAMNEGQGRLLAAAFKVILVGSIQGLAHSLAPIEDESPVEEVPAPVKANKQIMNGHSAWKQVEMPLFYSKQNPGSKKAKTSKTTSASAQGGLNLNEEADGSRKEPIKGRASSRLAKEKR
nr:hypothetical protein [Tanacetum cinerariifolium]